MATEKPSYLKEQAERCRSLARSETDPSVRARLMRMADAFERRVETSGENDQVAPGPSDDLSGSAPEE